MLPAHSRRLNHLLWGLGGVGCAVFAVATIGFAISYSPRLGDHRVRNTTVRFPLSPPNASGWTTEQAYPHLRFVEPTCVAYTNDGSRRAFVLERRGTVVMFHDDPQAKEKQTVLDLSSEVWCTKFDDDGAVAIALHPEFGQAGSPNADYFYLLYTARVGDKRFDRLSRFTLKGEQAKEQLVLIDQEDDNIWHNGGALTFGPDGFLYVGVGDEGTDGDGLGNGQRIDRDLFCGILRIDVDQRGGDISHPPCRQPDTGKTGHYFVPNDNPFVGVPGALEEFWAHGLRNPFRAAFDSVTGELWVTDVGHLRREEINLIEKGGNYGWSYLEGSLSFEESYLRGKRPQTFHGTEQLPIWEYPHLNGDNCVIGGLVYRGAKNAELEGKFLYADNGSGRVWALSRDQQGEVNNVELLSLPLSSRTGIASLQPDAEGEPLLVILGAGSNDGGMILRMVPSVSGSSDTLPKLLSLTGLFDDPAKLIPSPGVLPYEVNASQESGEARVRRWVMLPGDGSDPDPQVDRIGISQSDQWTFPTGTVFVQHFDLPNQNGRWRPVETRVLVRHQQGGVYGASYRWNESGSDAMLVQSAEAVEPATTTQGIAGHSNWHSLDSQSCLACHNQNAGFILGINQRQLNRAVTRQNWFGSSHQLIAWARAGMFSGPIDPADLGNASRLVDPADEQANLDLRARSYLDVNCGSCHRPGGARAGFFASFPVTQSPDALQVKPKQGDFGISAAQIVTAGDPLASVLYYRMAKLGQGRMPFVGSQRLDSEGLRLIRQWIEQLEPCSNDSIDSETAASRVQQNKQVDQLINGDVDGDARIQLIESLLGDTRGALALWQSLHERQGSNEPDARELRDVVVAMATQSESGSARDLFEWYLPPQERTQRLGTQFDFNQVLSLQGDAERGRQLYAEHEALLCRSCHDSRPDGRSIGPELSQLARKWSRRDLLHQIVFPSEQIDPKFTTWMAQTDDGRILSGLMLERTDEFVTLVEANGTEHRVETEALEVFKTSSQSMMPEHLMQALTAQQAADLLEYLQHAATDKTNQ